MFLMILSLFLSSDFVHSDESYNFTSFCICHSSGRLGKYYCGHELSTTNPDCMTHALYACINGPDKVARVFKYCKNSQCGHVSNRDNYACMDLHEKKYFRAIETGKTPKCEGCWFPVLKDGFKYADRTFYYDTIRDNDTLFHIFRRTGNNQWVNITFRQ